MWFLACFRFVCNAKNCRYQTIDETMLSFHLQTLHPNEVDYKCPHCNADLGTGNIERILSHLRMHSSRIYVCSKCNFIHYSRQNADKHIEDVHKGTTDAIISTIVRAADDPKACASATPAAAATSANSLVHKWRCMMCTVVCMTRAQMVSHAQLVHSIVNQYQCDVCKEMQSNAKSAIIDHMNSNHPKDAKVVKYFYEKFKCNEAEETTPIWRRDDPNKVS